MKRTAKEMLDELIEIYNAKYQDFTYCLELIEEILKPYKIKERKERLK